MLQFFITLAITATASGCGTLIKVPVTIDDEDLYYLKEASPTEWAVHMHFLSTGQDQVAEDAWNAQSAGKVCMLLSAFDDFNTEIGKLCSQVPCDYQTVQNLKNLIAHLKEVSKKK